MAFDQFMLCSRHSAIGINVSFSVCIGLSMSSFYERNHGIGTGPDTVSSRQEQHGMMADATCSKIY